MPRPGARSAHNEAEHMIIQKKIAYGAAALAFTLGGVTTATGPASAAAPSATAGWKCSTDGGSTSTWAYCSKGHSWVEGYFYASGEHFHVYDHFGNGHSTIAYLKVAGSGTATFSSGGKKHKDFNESFSENKKVQVKVCTSSSSKAVCSGWSPAGRT